MSTQLDDLLCQRYPAIFAQRHLPMTQQTAMCWGFSCGDGWFDLIDRLCGDLQEAADVGRIPQPVAVQVNEKFGEPRFYLVGRGSDEAEARILRATLGSMTICETCGAPGALRTTRGYYRIRCDEHAPPDSEVVPSEPPER